MSRWSPSRLMALTHTRCCVDAACSVCMYVSCSVEVDAKFCSQHVENTACHNSCVSRWQTDRQLVLASTWWLMVRASRGIIVYLRRMSGCIVSADLLFIALLAWSVFTARRSYASAVLGVAILSVLSDACFVTKPNNALRIFWYHTKGQSL